jgi:hypothetical protein
VRQNVGEKTESGPHCCSCWGEENKALAAMAAMEAAKEIINHGDAGAGLTTAAEAFLTAAFEMELGRLTPTTLLSSMPKL